MCEFVGFLMATSYLHDYIIKLDILRANALKANQENVNLI
jgi:hypothetical protein